MLPNPHVPRGTLILILVTMGMAVIGWASPAPNSFTQAVADTLYCAIANANCLNNYCNTSTVSGTTGTDNCNLQYNASGGYCPDSTFQGIVAEIPCSTKFNPDEWAVNYNGTKRTFSSATFTKYTTASCCVPVAPPAEDAITSTQVTCSSQLQLSFSNIAGIAKYRMVYVTSGHTLNGVQWEENPGVASQNFTATGFWDFTGLVNVEIMQSWTLQISVTGTGTVTVYQAGIRCMAIGSTGILSANVG